MKVVTAVVNNPTFIEIQYHTLKKYFKGDYEFIVFNDAKAFPDFTNNGDVTIRSQISEMCKKLNIQCINIPNEKHRSVQCAAQRCADSMNFILKYQLANPDKYLLLDSDMFIIDSFDPSKYSACSSAVILQTRNNDRTKYIWNGIYYFDFTKMNNINLLDWNTCPGCDVGGMMQTWLSLQDPASIYFMRHLYSCSWDASSAPTGAIDPGLIFKGLPSPKDDAHPPPTLSPELIDFFTADPRNVNGKFFCEIYDDVFLHYRAGGNWMRQSPAMHSSLTNKLKEILISS